MIFAYPISRRARLGPGVPVVEYLAELALLLIMEGVAYGRIFFCFLLHSSEVVTSVWDGLDGLGRVWTEDLLVGA